MYPTILRQKSFHTLLYKLVEGKTCMLEQDNQKEQETHITLFKAEMGHSTTGKFTPQQTV